jgi:orotidine-5'-phosphate decarboxylase
MTRQNLITSIYKKKSFLCVGLDPDIHKLPPHLLQYENPFIEFCKAIIDATSDLCVAYKPNVAFFEALGSKGWYALQVISAYLPEDTLNIADAKRGDIGNTASQYAKAFFEEMPFDAITLNAYMGKDAITPFLSYEQKWAVILGLTSNEGSKDFQYLISNGIPLYRHTIEKAMTWGTKDNTMFVVGATHPEGLKDVRSFCPNHFLLIPGVGAQGGNLSEVYGAAATSEIEILVNVTRDILYASSGEDFAEKAREKALYYQKEMAALMMC